MFLRRRSQCGLTQTSGLSSVENRVQRHHTEMLKTRQLETDILYSLLNILSLPSSFRVGSSLTHALASLSSSFHAGSSLTHALAFPQVCCSHPHCPVSQLTAFHESMCQDQEDMVWETDRQKNNQRTTNRAPTV